MAQGMSESTLAENQHRTTEPIQHFSATVETWKSHSPYITSRHAVLCAYHSSDSWWDLLGIDTIQKFSIKLSKKKKHLVFFQDRDKIASVKSFRSCRLSKRLHNQKQGQEQGEQGGRRSLPLNGYKLSVKLGQDMELHL